MKPNKSHRQPIEVKQTPLAQGTSRPRLFARMKAVCQVPGWVLLSTGMLFCCVLVGVFVGWEPLLWKRLAAQTLVYADWAGVCATLTEAVPGGLLRWVSRLEVMCGVHAWLLACVLMVQSVVFLALWRWWAFRSEERSWCSAMRFVPILVPLILLNYLGTSLWTIQEPSFPFVYSNVFILVLITVGLVKRRVPVEILLPCCLPVLGFPALLCGVVAAVYHLSRRHWVRCAAVCLAMGGAVAVAWQWLYPATQRSAVLFSNMIWFNEPNSGFWNTMTSVALLAIVVPLILPQRWKPRMGILSPLVCVAGIALMCAVAKPGSGWKELLEIEELADHGQYAKILSVKSSMQDTNVLLKVYRILALFHTRALPAGIFTNVTEEPCMKRTLDLMPFDGYKVLFHYGYMLPARKWCYEKISMRSMCAETLQTLGWIALATSEDALAYRYFSQLARVPFYRAEAKQMLLAIRTRDAKLLPPWLQRLIDIHLRLSQDPGNVPFHIGANLEQLIYERYAIVKAGDEPMIQMYFSASLLLGLTDPLIENLGVLENLYPNGLPRYYAEGLIYALSQLPPEKQPAIPPTLIRPEDVVAYQEYLRDDAAMAQLGNALTPEHVRWFCAKYHDSFYLYMRGLKQ